MEKFDIAPEKLINSLISEIALLHARVTLTEGMLQAFLSLHYPDELKLMKSGLPSLDTIGVQHLQHIADRLSIDSNEMIEMLKDLLEKS